MLQKEVLFFLLGAATICGQLIDSADDFSYDSNNRLQSHALLYTGGATCDSAIGDLELDFRSVGRATEKFGRSLFNSSAAIGKCNIACLERGTQYEHISYPFIKAIDIEPSKASSWINNNCQSTEVGFLSYLDGPAGLYWVNFEGEQQYLADILPGERNTYWINSFLGHQLIVADKEDPSHHYLSLTVEFNSINPIGEYKSHITERDVREEVMRTFQFEWEKAHDVSRTFTQFGFDKGQLPKDLFASMSAFYYNNQHHATIEEWGGKGVFVNWWEKDVFFVAMPFQLKKRWQARLKTLVQNWVGVELELTDIYGMRRYEDGARLLTHVDRQPTHATSLIINVAQGNIREPWAIEVYDFADRLHEVEMNPGDIVYYESARCLHGRMKPLQGGYYVNLFAHYRPVGDDAWYKKPNPPGTTAPVLDIGRCTTNGTKATCDGDVPVPYLSPALEEIHSAMDLYKYWEKTGELQRNTPVGVSTVAPAEHDEF